MNLNSTAVDFRIGNTVPKNIPATILKKDIFELSSYAVIPIHGLIGYDFSKVLW